MNKVAVGIASFLALAFIFSNISAAAGQPDNTSMVANSSFETGDFTGWSVGTVIDSAGVVPDDGYARPYQGSYMARLGTPRYNGQPPGSNTIYQEFTVTEPILRFSYNIFTYDYQPYNHFHYLVKDLTTDTAIVQYAQTAWGSGSELKSTGWIVVRIDLSAYVGDIVRLEIDVGGTGDPSFATWAYVDGAEVLPTTTARLDGTLGRNDWYLSDVQVTLTAICVENLATLISEYSFDNTNWIPYSAPFTISDEGSTSVYFRSSDNCGHVEQAKVLTVLIDKTSPSITGGPTTQPNATGWYNNDVVVEFAASDNVSGINFLTPNVTLSGDGENQTVIGRASDMAGNEIYFEVAGINIDKTPPETQAILAGTYENTYYASDVAVTLVASDSLSGVAATYYNLDGSGWLQYTENFTVSSEGQHTIDYKSVDLAGSEETAKTVSFLITKASDNLRVEAFLRFDLDTMDISVYDSRTGFEVGYTVLREKRGGWQLRSYTLEFGGKNMVLTLVHTSAGKQVRVNVVSIQYDGSKASIAPVNDMHVEYSLDKKGEIKEVSQQITVFPSFHASAEYKAKADETKINLKAKREHKQKDTIDGFAGLKLLTDKGNLTYGDY